MGEILQINNVDNTNPNPNIEHSGGKETPIQKDITQGNQAAPVLETTTEQEPTEDAVLKFIEKRAGRKIDTIDSIIPKKEPTEAETKAAQEKKQKQMVERFIDSGGTLENFVKLNEISKRKADEIGREIIIKELSVTGLDEDSIKEELGDFADDELEEFDETDLEKIKKKKSFYKKIFRYIGEKEVLDATSVLEDIEADVNGVNDRKDEERKINDNISSQIEDIEKSYVGKKITLELGKFNDIELPSIDTEIPKEIVSEVASLLKNRKERHELFFNKDGSLNLLRLSEILVSDKMKQHFLRTGFIKGQTDAIDAYRAKFPNDVHRVFPANQRSSNNSSAGKIKEGSIHTSIKYTGV